ncbi:MAG: hypothetical protein JXA17_00850, partial [Dehalococcoidales bacterium]|nr:hypothetical protein [Dehalococcoidales bacterium]
MSLRTPKLVSEIAQGFVEVNSKDALQAGLKNKDVVTLATRRGSIETRAKITDNVPPGLLFAAFHFPDSRGNALTNPALVPGAKCAGTKVCAARMEVKQ